MTAIAAVAAFLTPNKRGAMYSFISTNEPLLKVEFRGTKYGVGGLPPASWVKNRLASVDKIKMFELTLKLSLTPL